MSQNAPPVSQENSNSAHSAAAQPTASQNGAPVTKPAGGPPGQIPQPAARGWRFWAIFPALSIATLLVGLDSTITSAALPLITGELHSGDNYIWILNSYLLTSTAFLPLYGQLAQVLGRRWPAMIAVCIFLLGSGISGGASSTGMLIAGRLVQGMGGAGITAMTQLIISDLVYLRERGKYIGIIYAVFGLGTALGPPVGGVIAQYASWRWAFWINLPIGGVTLVVQFFFLQIIFAKRLTLQQKLRQIDWIGNILLPTIPPRMFRNRTSAAGLFLTFLQSMLSMWRLYFLPVYFQAVLLASVSRSGVLLLPTILIGVPTAIISGQLLNRWSRHKPIHIFGFAVATLASGLYIDFDVDSSLAKVVIYQIIAGIGGGCLLTTMLPSVQASHPQADVAAATSTWAYMRAFGNVWGVAIPAAIFNNQIQRNLSVVSDAEVRSFLGAGDAYSHVSAAYITSLPIQVQTEVVSTYLKSLKVVWDVCLAFNAFGFILVFIEKEIKLRTTVSSDYKLKEKTQGADKEAVPEKTESSQSVP